MQNLERDEPVMFCILREIHGRHPAFAELAIDGIRLRYSGTKSVEH
jgi:hypothetical protein